MTSLFQGARQAQHYATSRPTYPKAVYEYIASKCSAQTKRMGQQQQQKQEEPGTSSTSSTSSTTTTTTCCIDVGCGTGQATAALVDYFDSVIGIDPSPTQLEQAIQHPRITYRLGSVEEQLASSSIQQLDTAGNQSVQCITSAQAVHWIDLPTFYRHAHRILPPGGVLALWTYGMPSFPNNPSLEQAVWHLYDDVLGEYWDPRRKLVENLYRDLPSIDDFYPHSYTTERIADRSEWNIRQEHVSEAQLRGYIRSWSAYTKYCEVHKLEPGSALDPVENIVLVASSSSTSTETDTITTPCMWPVAMVISVKK